MGNISSSIPINQSTEANKEIQTTKIKKNKDLLINDLTNPISDINIQFSDKVVATTVLVLIIIAIIVFMFIYMNSKKQTTTKALTCDSGQCALSTTGIRNCPHLNTEKVSLNYLNDEFTCTGRYQCVKPFEYAISKKDNSALTSTCDTNDLCNCVQYQRCPDYITSFFTLDDGDNTHDIFHTRGVYNQQNYHILNDGTTKVYEPPLSMKNPSVETCTLLPKEIYRMWPSKCLTGVLAPIITTDIGTIDPLNLEFKGNGTVYGCVRADPTMCTEGLVVYNRDTQKASCMKSSVIPDAFGQMLDYIYDTRVYNTLGTNPIN